MMVLLPAGSVRVTWVQAEIPPQFTASTTPLMVSESRSQQPSVLVLTQKLRVVPAGVLSVSVADEV